MLAEPRRGDLRDVDEARVGGDVDHERVDGAQYPEALEGGVPLAPNVRGVLLHAERDVVLLDGVGGGALDHREGVGLSSLRH